MVMGPPQSEYSVFPRDRLEGSPWGNYDRTTGRRDCDPSVQGMGDRDADPSR
jgi:hypothetical protein